MLLILCGKEHSHQIHAIEEIIGPLPPHFRFAAANLLGKFGKINLDR